MFRRLYWVVERFDENGTSRVVGVFTSIPDLIHKGIERQHGQSIRLALVKLDSDKEPLGMWTAGEFGRIEADLEPFVKTEEFSLEHCRTLSQALATSSADSRSVAV